MSMLDAFFGKGGAGGGGFRGAKWYAFLGTEFLVC
jgi:hypothetical protein